MILTAFAKKLLIFVSTLTLVAIPISAQGATPDPTTQGGSDGVLFMTEMSDHAIYVGDFKSTPTPKTVYWQQDGSLVSEIAVTQTRVAWAANSEANPSTNPPRVASTILGKLLISNVGKTAGTVTEVAMPNNAVITGLASDFFNEKFYLTTKDGDVYSVKSDGTALTKEISADATVAKVAWGLWFDSYNSKLYWCDGNTQSVTGTLSMATVTSGTLSSPTVLEANFLAKCDGLGVDPATQVVYAAAYQAQTSNGNDFWMSFDTATSQKTSITITGTTRVAPSTMFVSHATSKIYFTAEAEVYEVNYDGSGLRVLYTGPHTSGGFQNIAVYYGQTLDTINSVAPSDTTKPTLSSGSLTPSAKVGSTAVETYKANETVTWAITGGKNASLFSIDPATGVLTFKKAPTKIGTFYVEIQATDTAKNSGDVQKIKVTVKSTLANTGATTNVIGLTALSMFGMGLMLTSISTRNLRKH